MLFRGFRGGESDEPIDASVRRWQPRPCTRPNAKTIRDSEHISETVGTTLISKQTIFSFCRFHLSGGKARCQE